MQGFAVLWGGQVVGEFPERTAAAMAFAYALRKCGQSTHPQALSDVDFGKFFPSWRQTYASQLPLLDDVVAQVVAQEQAAAADKAANGDTDGWSSDGQGVVQLGVHSIRIPDVAGHVLSGAIASWQQQRQAALQRKDMATATALQQQGLSEETLRWACKTAADAIVPISISASDLALPAAQDPSMRKLGVAAGFRLPAAPAQLQPSDLALTPSDLAVPPCLPPARRPSDAEVPAPGPGERWRAGADASLPLAMALPRATRDWEEGVIMNGLWKSAKDPFTSTRVRLRLPQPVVLRGAAARQAAPPLTGWRLCLGTAAISNVSVDWDAAAQSGSFQLSLHSTPAAGHEGGPQGVSVATPLPEAGQELPLPRLREQRMLRSAVAVGPVAVLAQPGPGASPPLDILRHSAPGQAPGGEDAGGLAMSCALAGTMRQWYDVWGQARSKPLTSADAGEAPPAKRPRPSLWRDGTVLALGTLQGGAALSSAPEWAWRHVDRVLGTPPPSRQGDVHWSQLPPWSGASLDAQGTVAAAAASIRAACMAWHTKLSTARGAASRCVTFKYRDLLLQQQRAMLLAQSHGQLAADQGGGGGMHFQGQTGPPQG